jgi:hypothetical protein
VISVVALGIPPAAAAHGFQKGSQTVARILATPVPVEVLGRDDELRLEASGSRTLVVLGYAGEPYLRFERGGGVSINLRSPAVTLNASRFPPARELASLARRTGGTPQWQRVSDGSSYTWVDHRIHLTTRTWPPAVRADPKREHLLKRWRVPLRIDGRAAAIRGDLRYEPARFDWVGAIPAFVGVAVVLAAVASVVVLRKGEK